MRTRQALPSIAHVAALAALAAGAATAADGLAPPDERSVWPQWQARIAVDNTRLAPVSLFDRGDGVRRASATTSLYGDYYFDAPGLRLPATVGGLRATSGIVGGNNRTLLQPGGETLPYVGFGYTGLAPKYGLRFSADLGMTVDTAPGKPLFGNQGFEAALRDLRLSPVLQLGVRYAF